MLRYSAISLMPTRCLNGPVLVIFDLENGAHNNLPAGATKEIILKQIHPIIVILLYFNLVLAIASYHSIECIRSLLNCVWWSGYSERIDESPTSLQKESYVLFDRL